MSLQQVFLEFQNWMAFNWPAIWTYPIPWSTLIWSAIGLFVFWNICVFIAAAHGAFLVERYKMMFDPDYTRKEKQE